MDPTILWILVSISATIAILAIVSIVFDLLVRRNSRVARRLDDEFQSKKSSAGKKSALFKDLSLLASETARTKSSMSTRFCDMVEQSGLAVSPRQLLIAAVTAGLSCGLLAALFGKQLWLTPLSLMAGFLLPIGFVQFCRMRRVELLRRQLPEAFELMSRTVRAGQTITSAFQVVADDFEDPVAGEFRCCHEQQNLGLSMDVALRDLARRTGVLEMRMFTVTLLIQRQSGGNPVEVLNNLADVIRKRNSLIGKVKALTGEGRMQALVLLLLPPALFAALFVLNREYVQVLLDRPLIFVGIAASEAFGLLWIRKIIRFDY